MRWAQATTSCHVGAPWPLDLASPEITLAVLDMTSGVDAGDDMILRSAQASTLFDRLASMPGSLQAASLAPFAVLPRSVIRNRLSIEQAAEQVAAAGEPYHSARFALGLYENGLLESGFEEASAHLTAITNPVLRLDIAERLTKLARAGADETSRQAALEAAGAILEPGQRWRALVRLAWQPGYPQAQLLKAALAAIDMIECPQERLIDASVAARVFSRRPQTLVEIDQSGPIFESLGVGRLASSLCGLPADYGDARGILYVAQTCLDLLSGLEHAAANDTHLHVEEGSLPDWAITAPKVELTVAIADELADLAEAEDPQVPQLPSVELAQRTYITCGYSIFACERWLDRPEHPLAWIAALAIAKGRPRRDRKVLEPLLFAIAADNEEMAAQASLMLTRGSTLVQRPGPDTDYEDMGFETLLWLGRKAVGPEKTRLRLVVACLIMDLQISDAEVITQLFDHMDNNPDDQLAVRFILEHLTWTSAEATRALKARMPGKDPELQAQMLIALAAIDLTQKEDEKRDEAGVVTRPAKRPFTAEDLAQTVQSLGATNNTAPFRIFAKGGEDFCALVEEACRSEPRKERLAGAFYNRLETAQLDIRTPMSDPAASYAALESFLGAKTRAAGEGLPFRHHRKACRALGAGPFGGDAVRLVTELLVDLTRTSRRDYELGGLIAATCVEFALFSPSLVAAALKKQLLGEAGLMAFLAQLIEAPPFGTSSATATALACLLRPLDRACVEALVAISQRPDVGDWILLEQCLVGVGRVERATLPICTSALASDRPRTQLLATRLLGILARDASAGAQTRRTASQALESFLVDPRAQGSIFIYSPATRSQQDGHVLDCGALANIARTELFLADGVE
jgi:hypothetical protein